MFKTAVIGRGLIGSAAARHLALSGDNVVLVGPNEPDDKQSHNGVFASHYDEGRITRALDPDPYWSALTVASIARYAEIEHASGIKFFTQSGALMAGPEDSAFIAGTKKVCQSAGIDAISLDHNALAKQFPFFAFPKTSVGYYEPKNAGHISPRNLVRAQVRAFERLAGEVFDGYVTSLRETQNGVELETSNGVVSAERVLICAGGHINGLLETPLALRPYARTVAFFEVDRAQIASLQNMPSVVMRYEDGRDPYILPPITYPNAKTYLKIGGDPDDRLLETDEDIKAWFKSGADLKVGAYLRDMIMELIPTLRIENMHVEPCMTTFTPNDHALFEHVSSRISVVGGACGRGAKCSDELGRLAAHFSRQN